MCISLYFVYTLTYIKIFPGKSRGIKISYIYVFLLLQIFSYVLRSVFRNALFYEFPAEYRLLHSFF